MKVQRWRSARRYRYSLSRVVDSIIDLLSALEHRRGVRGTALGAIRGPTRGRRAQADSLAALGEGDVPRSRLRPPRRVQLNAWH
jgi:hypothetical protein